jgi:DNA modification methylase
LRLKAAQRLGLARVPVVLADDLSAAQIKAFRLLFNRSASWADWDDELLGLELLDLQALDYDLGLTGFDDAELQRLLDLVAEDGSGGADEDAVPEPPAEPVTRPGDLWHLGSHRLLCGDATAADDVTRLLGGAKPHLLVCDPPYGVQYAPDWRIEAGVSNTERTGTVRNDDRADWREAWALFPGDVAYVWHAGVHARTVAESLEACGFSIRAQLIWVKNRFVLSRGHYHWQHEPCFYALRDGGCSRWQGARDQSTVWQIATNADDTATVHGTQKPVECMLRPILNNSARGDAIYEPFAGSGTTIIASEKSGRRCLGMEIEPRYCDVIVERWQHFTGKQAVLEGDGRTFDAIAGERQRAAA